MKTKNKIVTIIISLVAANAFAGGSTNGDSRTAGGTIGLIADAHGTSGRTGGNTIGPKSEGGYGIGRLAGAGTSPGGTASGLRGGAAGSRPIGGGGN